VLLKYLYNLILITLFEGAGKCRIQKGDNILPYNFTIISREECPFPLIFDRFSKMQKKSVLIIKMKIWRQGQQLTFIPLTEI
jgi:hypothetical protein